MSHAQQKRMNGKCESCGARHTRLADLNVIRGLAYYQVDGQNAGRDDNMRFTVRCECGRKVTLRDVRGKVTSHKCDTACAYAEGDLHTCRCSCGGLHHGMMLTVKLAVG